MFLWITVCIIPWFDDFMNETKLLKLLKLQNYQKSSDLKKKD